MKDKAKNKILKSTRGKQQITCKGTPIISQLISQQKLYKPEGNGMIDLKWWKRRNCNQKYLTSGKLSFRFDGEIKRFPDKQKLREFNITKPALQQMLKKLL